jgi:hypothetical protein
LAEAVEVDEQAVQLESQVAAVEVVELLMVGV